MCAATFGFGMCSANILALHADVFPPETMGSAVGSLALIACLALFFSLGPVEPIAEA